MYAEEICVIKSEAAELKSRIVICVSEGCMGLKGCETTEWQNSALEIKNIYTRKKLYFWRCYYKYLKNSDILIKIFVGSYYMSISHKCQFNKWNP